MFYNTLNIFSTIGLAPGALGGMNTVLGWKCLLSNKILDFLNVFILSDTPSSYGVPLPPLQTKTGLLSGRINHQPQVHSANPD